MSWAYYNEIDPFAAAWLRELILAGHIALGEVDERSIEVVQASDFKGFSQHHFFAGIGGWSYALRLAGWSDDRPVWTGSCPCQPFSHAGNRRGTADARHLWPAWLRLIEQCRPSIIFGEQVEAAIRTPWLDLVYDDLEAQGYAVGAVSFPAASVGAPHIRQRLYFVADRPELRQLGRRTIQTDGYAKTQFEGLCEAGELAHTDGGHSGSKWEQSGGQHRQQLQDGGACELGNGDESGLQRRGVPASGCSSERTAWTPSDFVWCRDGKYRPVEPGTFPLAHGVSGRVGRLRGYGNAIVPAQAAQFIKAYSG